MQNIDLATSKGETLRRFCTDKEKQDLQRTYSVALMRVRVTTVAVEK